MGPQYLKWSEEVFNNSLKIERAGPWCKQSRFQISFTTDKKWIRKEEISIKSEGKRERKREREVKIER